jgi:hypothetical protein
MVGWKNWTNTYLFSQPLAPEELKTFYKVEKYLLFRKENAGLSRKHIEIVGFSTKKTPRGQFLV